MTHIDYCKNVSLLSLSLSYSSQLKGNKYLSILRFEFFEKSGLSSIESRGTSSIRRAES